MGQRCTAQKQLLRHGDLSRGWRLVKWGSMETQKQARIGTKVINIYNQGGETDKRSLFLVASKIHVRNKRAMVYVCPWFQKLQSIIVGKVRVELEPGRQETDSMPRPRDQIDFLPLGTDLPLPAKSQPTTASTASPNTTTIWGTSIQTMSLWGTF